MKKYLFRLLIIWVLLMSTSALADVGHESEIEEGRQLVESKVSCDELTDEQLEAIGEYYMELMHPGEAHEAMHEMMGLEEGTEEHEQFHINFARRMYCDTSDTNYTAYRGMMGGGMMPMMMGRNIPIQTNVYGMMGTYGYNYGYWYLLNTLYVILLIGLIILVYLWIIKLLRAKKK